MSENKDLPDKLTTNSAKRCSARALQHPMIPKIMIVAPTPIKILKPIFGLEEVSLPTIWKLTKKKNKDTRLLFLKVHLFCCCWFFLILSTGFYWDYLCFSSFLLLMWYTILFDICILNYPPCIPGMNPTWLWCIILLFFI